MWCSWRIVEGLDSVFSDDKAAVYSKCTLGQGMQCGDKPYYVTVAAGEQAFCAVETAGRPCHEIRPSMALS